MRKRMLLFLYYGVGIVLFIISNIFQPGIYHGEVQIFYTFQIESHLSWVTLRAQTRPRWYWTRPHNHQYDAAVFEIGLSNTVANADLGTGIWTKDKDTGKLDISGLGRMIGPPKILTEEDRRQLHGILTNLDALHNGTFYRPNHHGYNYEKPIELYCQHFTPGKNFGILGLMIWIGFWPFCMLFSKRSPKGWFPPPIKAFLVTIFIVVVVDILMILLEKASAPGPFSEGLEFVFGLFNFFALMLSPNGCMSIENIVLAVLLWGNIVSGIVWFKTKIGYSQIIETKKT